MNSYLKSNLATYLCFQVMFVIFVVLFSSLGAFFHFLLDHEISIVEAWLHNNQWELLILAKILSLFILNRWFKIKSYELKPVRQLLRELISWPEPRSIVVSFFMLTSYIGLSGSHVTQQNIGYWYYQLTSFLGLFFFFGIEFVALAYLDDVHKQGRDDSSQWKLALGYLVLFIISFRTSVPDYYRMNAHMVFCEATLLLLSGRYFKSWSNAVCFLLVFVAPMGALFGLDPVWGNDFSPFALSKKLNPAFLAVIWMISFFYYHHRDKLMAYPRKIFR